MVVGIEKFREYFADHEQHYAIIGGTACELLFTEVGLEFRRTRDIDIVLCVEVIDVAFGQAFRRFLEAGGYQARERGENGKKEFYRFHRPMDALFPSMIELFARRSGAFSLPETAITGRIPVDEGVVSLSAILLDDVYYDALKLGKRMIDGVSIIDQRILIPLKALAFLNNKAEAEAGRKIKREDIQKHRIDVLRLAELLKPDDSFDLAVSIRNDLRRFIDDIEADTSLDPGKFGLILSKDETIALLRSVYRLAPTT